MSATATPARTPERRARRAALIGALAAVVLVGGVIGWLAYQRSQVQVRFDTLSARFEALQSDARARAVDLPEGLGESVAINLFPHAAALQQTIDALDEPLEGLPNTLPVDLQLAGLDEGRRGRLLQLVQRALTAERAWSTEQTELPDELAVNVRQWLAALVKERTPTFESCADHTVAVLRYAYALDAVSEVREAEENTLDQLERAIAECAAGAPREARHRAADAILRLADERVPPLEAVVGVLDMIRIVLEGASESLESPFGAGRAMDLMDRAEEQLDEAEALVAHRGALDSFGDGDFDGRLVQTEQQVRLRLRLIAAVFRAGAAPGDAAAVEGMSDPVAGPILVEDGAVRAPGAEALVMYDSITLAEGPNSGGTLRIESPDEQGSAGGVTRGRLEREVIRGVIDTNTPAVLRCYESALVNDPALEGRVTVRFIIGPDGAVDNALVQDSELHAPRVEDCVATAVRQMQFPAPEGGGIVIVNYPFMFTRGVPGE